MGKGGKTIQSNGLMIPEPTPSLEIEQIAANQLYQSIEISELKKVLDIKVNYCLNQVEEIKKIYLKKALIVTKNKAN